jgi:sterol desaturase/sphingolipid hydroxylase (fatty acid hydroxylase superfamily)
MFGIPIALATFNAAEWLIHKHVLHGLGRSKKSVWAFHWHEHHGNARREEMRDETYERTPFALHAQGKELIALSAGALAVLSIAPVVPFYSGTMLFCIGEYYYKHRKSHEDPEWAREHLPWHYDHHMGPNQNSNWGVVRPWMDNLMGTREPYVGTEREARDRKRRADRKRAKEMREQPIAA